ncbi:MAG: fatty acid desaturase [Candidatus Binatia bacterium]|nr:fatty acid desaturase [Candidatus Binatia bacterium]
MNLETLETPVLSDATPPMVTNGVSQEKRRTIRALARSIPKACYENPTWKGLLYLGRDLTVYALGTGLLLASSSVSLVLAGWFLTSLAIAALFVIGHDAAHGSLFKSPRLNYFVGQLAMLPSLHTFSVWAYGHNRVHHAFPGCEGLDFVWHPVTLEEYQKLSRWEKLRHRMDWSLFGAGTYYTREIWWNRLVNMPPPDKMERAFLRDRIAVTTFLVVMSVAVGWFGWAQTGTIGGALWTWTKVLFVPWFMWNALIGWAVYIQHISPQMPWHTRRRWRKYAGQVETTCNYVMPLWLNFFWHNIFVHVPHHVDPRIPFYNLPDAAKALNKADSDVSQSYPYRFREYFDSTKHCKLYDFEREAWTDYQGANPVTAADYPPRAA